MGLTLEQLSNEVFKAVSKHVTTFGGCFEMDDDLKAISFWDHDMSGIWLSSYEDFLEVYGEDDE